MNFLGHLFLTQDDEALTIGNFLGDFIKNRELPQLEAGVRNGVYIHREIDAFTDSHPAVRESLALLRPQHGKYAGVVWDVLSDTLLMHSWSCFDHKPPSEFTAKIHGIISRQIDLIPGNIQPMVQRMLLSDFLSGNHIDSTLSRLQKRASSPQLLEGGALSLDKHYEALLAGFEAFYPDMIRKVLTLRSERKW
jgi:acyl carrier protein phosphodiesterase